MYDASFINVKNSQGKLYRDKKTGDFLQHCMHSWIICPEFEYVEEFHANFIPEECKRFNGFTGICQICGEVIRINADNVVGNEDDFEKRIEEILKRRSVLDKPKKEN